jgi:16S rRNA A1518/A1519 N6-dimethyltransferase RsmA/KsgA/DIM1 with predicted DNA glycosylase/AP lyase activity
MHTDLPYPPPSLQVPSEKGFLALVGKAFLSRRKMMRNSIEPLYTTAQVEEALGKCGLRKDARAQDLSLNDFVRVHHALSEMVVSSLLGGEGEEVQVEEEEL